MKKKFTLISLVLLLSVCLSAQKNKIITVKAGTRVLDYFPVQERYRYPQFLDGQILFTNGVVSSNRLNYNFLLNEMEFIKSPDTLIIVKKKDIRHIVVEQDTFIYNNGYLELIHSGYVKVYLKQYIKMKDIVKIGAFGMPNRGSSIDSYNSMSLDGNFYELIPTEDIVFQKTLEYYIATPSSGFVDFRKKNVIQLFPQKADEIQIYLKANKVNFESRQDLIRFADYLDGL